MNEMQDRDGGQWLCNIWPYDLEVGLALNNYVKFLGIDFTRAKVEYRVIIAQMALDEKLDSKSYMSSKAPINDQSEEMIRAPFP